MCTSLYVLYISISLYISLTVYAYCKDKSLSLSPFHYVSLSLSFYVCLCFCLSLSLSSFSMFLSKFIIKYCDQQNLVIFIKSGRSNTDPVFFPGSVRIPVLSTRIRNPAFYSQCLHNFHANDSFRTSYMETW